MMCLMFIGTIVLAQTMVSRAVLSGRQSPSGWPIAFTLPDAYRWNRIPESRSPSRNASEAPQLLTLIGNSPSRGLCTLMFGCGDATRGPEIVRSTGGFGILDQLLGSWEIDVGPLTGRIMVRSDKSGETRIYVRASIGDDYPIEILVTSEQPATYSVSIVESICASIEITDPSLDPRQPQRPR